MAALDETHLCPRGRGDAGKRAVDPRPCRVHHNACVRFAGGAGPLVGFTDDVAIAGATDGGDAAACADIRAARAGVPCVEDDEAGIVHPAVGVLESGAVFRLERLALGGGRKVQRCGWRQALAAAEMIVEEQSGAQQPRGPEARMVRQYKSQRPDDVRRVRPQDLALDQRLAHQPELVVFEVAQAAMDELRRPGRSGAGEVIHFGKRHAVAAPGRITGDAAAVNAATDDEDVAVSRHWPPGRALLAGATADEHAKRTKTKVNRKQDAAIAKHNSVNGFASCRPAFVCGKSEKCSSRSASSRSLSSPAVPAG